MLIVLMLTIIYTFLSTLMIFYGSDHHIHLRLIKDVKKNGHKFVNNFSNVIEKKRYPYPQLFHFILSFASLQNTMKTYKIYKFILTFFEGLFFWYLLKYYYINHSLLYASISIVLLYFTPFSFIKWNASNVGLSARSLGVFMVRIYLYLFFAIQEHLINPEGYACVLIFTVISFLIIISSIFATQFLIFFAIISILVLKTFVPILSLTLAILCCFIFLKSWFVNFLNGQAAHKYLYARFFAKKFILLHRYSIWRDLVYDFWVKIRANFKSSLVYIIYNPFLTIFWGFIIIPIVIILAFYTNDLEVFKIHLTAVKLVGIGLLVFFLTSFRFSRFLGEPDRYVEFVYPFAILLFYSFIKTNLPLSISVAVFCIILCLVQAIMWMKNVKKLNETNYLFKLDKPLLQNLSFIDKLTDLNKNNSLRIACNTDELLRMLISLEFKSLQILEFVYLKLRDYTVQDLIGDKYPNYAIKPLCYFIKECDINCCLVDTSLPETNDLVDFLTQEKFEVNFIFEKVTVYIKN